MRSYIILTTPRTGSHLLADGLYVSGVAGYPREYFEPKLRRRLLAGEEISSIEYLKVLKQVSGELFSGVLAIKITWRQLQSQLFESDENRNNVSDEEVALLKNEIPNLRFVYLNRENKLRQAISYAKALRTQEWVREEKVKTRTQSVDLTYDHDLITALMNRIQGDDSKVRSFLRSIDLPVLELSYEALCEDYYGALSKVIRFTGARDQDLNIPPPRLAKIADKFNDEWEEIYLSTCVSSGKHVTCNNPDKKKVLNARTK